MLVAELMPPLPRLLVLDEAFDGLDAASRISTFLLGSLIFLTLRND